MALKGQLHCHTTNSDGINSSIEIVTAYKNAGFDFISITDHNYITPNPDITGIVYIVGVEETNVRHITAYDVETRSESKNTQEIINEHRYNGKITSIAHPKWYGTYMSDIEIMTYYNNNFIEVYNAAGGDPVFAEDYWDDILSSGKKLFAIAVDDCHNISGVAFNNGYVVVFADVKDKESILQALRNGQFYASTGNDIAIDVNDNIITASSTELSNFTFIGYNGNILKTVNGVNSADYTIKGNELYVRVESIKVSDSTKAWAQPIFIDCEGDDGRTHLPLLNKYIKKFSNNKNLLINPQFTINQRKQTFYEGITYTVDMWKITNENSSLTVNDGYVSLTASGGNAFFRQPIEDTAFLANKTITLSAYVKGNTGYMGIINDFPTGNNIKGITIDTAYNDWTLVTYTLLANTLDKVAQVYFRSDSGGTLDIKCVKLEIGTISTIDSELPVDYREELPKCQRYLYVLNSDGDAYGYIAMGVSTALNVVQMFVYPPVQMYKKPSLSFVGNWRLNAASWTPSNTNVTDIGISGYSTSGSALLIVSASVTSGLPYYLNANNDTTARIYLSAEI